MSPQRVEFDDSRAVDAAMPARAPGFLACTVCLGILCAPGKAAARKLRFKAVVVSVPAGDELTVVRLRRGTHAQGIRLLGVSVPHGEQRYGLAARWFTRNRTFGKLVSVKLTSVKGEDGEPLATVRVHGVNLNQTLVKAGAAWHDGRKNPDPRLARLQQEAQKARRGLWAFPGPVPPWKWQRVVFAGDTATRLYHRRHKCPALNKGCRTCTVWLDNGQNALKAGYRPHACVKPEDLRYALQYVPPPPIIKPPDLPPGKDRACRVDADCVFEPFPPCICGGCGTEWRRAVNRATARRLKRQWARLKCGWFACPRCRGTSLGTRTLCEKRQCTVAGPIPPHVKHMWMYRQKHRRSANPLGL